MSLVQPKSMFAITVVVTACALSSAAVAQYVWIDGNGSKQYSDMPPPASVPTSRILKAPRAAQMMAPAAIPPAETDPATADKSKAPPTLADRNADFTKRRAQQAEQDKKAAEQNRVAAEKAKSCARARQYQKTLASGVRMASTDQNGERVFLDDAQRGLEERETKNVLKECGER